MGVCMCGFFNVWVCMCGFCYVRVYVCVGFLNMFGCVFCKLWVCVCVCFVMCEHVNVWII